MGWFRRQKEQHEQQLILDTIREMGIGDKICRCKVQGRYLTEEWFPAEILGYSYSCHFSWFNVVVYFPNGHKVEQKRQALDIKDVVVEEKEL